MAPRSKPGQRPQRQEESPAEGSGASDQDSDGHPQLYKFPRTPHLRDLGAATRDDLVLTAQEAAAWLRRGVVLEEKVDGANLGISFDPDTGAPRCQKRGHWVTPTSEAQFAKLAGWLEQHAPALRPVLSSHYVLFGEWLAARHSVPYDCLPDWFLAFDVLDTQAQRFLSSAERDKLLAGTGIRTVPALLPPTGHPANAPPPPPPLPEAPGTSATAAQPTRAWRFDGPEPLQALTDLLMACRSRLISAGGEAGGEGECEGEGGNAHWVEGLYLRVEEGPWLVTRAKLVHPAFKQAIADSGGHWAKRQLVANRVRPDLWPDDERQTVRLVGQQQNDEQQRHGGQQQQQQHPQAEEAQLAQAPAVAMPPPPVPQAAAQQRQQQPQQHPAATRPARQQRPGHGTAAGAADAAAGHGMGFQPAPGALEPSACRLELCCSGMYVALVGRAVDAAARQQLVEAGSRVPGHYVANRVARDGPHHHVTLVTPPEMDQLQVEFGMTPEDVLQLLQPHVDPSSWLPLGLGRAASSGDEALFCVVAWPTGHSGRAALGLTRPQHFHITLGFAPDDVHTRPKDLTALVQPLGCQPDGGSGAAERIRALADAAQEAGLTSLQPENRAAVAVLQALAELSTGGAATAGGSGATADAAAGTSAGSSSSSSAYDPRVLDAVRCLSEVALSWLGRHGNASHGDCAAAAAPPGTVAAFVAGAAHVALARVDGRCNDVEEAGRHAAAAIVYAGQVVTARCSGGAAAAAAACVLEASAQALRAKAAWQAGDYGAAHTAFTLALACQARLDAQLVVAGDVMDNSPVTHLRRVLADALEPRVVLAKGQAAAAKKLQAAADQRQQQQQEAAAAAGSRLRASTGGSLHAGDGEGYGGPLPALHGQFEDGAAAAAAWGGDTALDPRSRAVVAAVEVPRDRSGAGGEVQDVTLMRNSSWLVPGALMGSSTPKSREQVFALAKLGVGLVITLTEETPLPASWFTQADAGAPAAQGAAPVRNLFVPVPNYEPPSEGQMDIILEAIERHCCGQMLAQQQQQQDAAAAAVGRGVLVHCGGGKGRAGTALACYLCKWGLAPPTARDAAAAPDAAAAARWMPSPPAMSAVEAVRLVRTLRPGSIETEQQRAFVGVYCKALWRSYGEGAEAREVQQEQQQQQQALSGSEGEGEGEGGGGEGAGAAGGLPGSYPSTPHLPFSPQVASDDTQLDAAGCSGLLNQPVVVTEKLDGGNCCIHRGTVYARTHKHPASHASFSPIKALAAQQLAQLPNHLALFGENMAAVHSIQYQQLPATFFLFAVWDGRQQAWLSWEDVEAWADRLGLHMVPVLHKGAFRSLDEMAALMSGDMQQGRSAVDGQSPREGFVVRTTAAIPGADFARCVAKYVRAGHLQTDDSWRRTWRQANIVPRPPPAPTAAADPQQLQAKAPAAAAAGPAAAAAAAPAAGAQRAPARGGRGGGPSNAVAARLPKLLLLVGLPGSGKSTFARSLLDTGRWLYVCQDEIQSRRAAESAFGHAMLRGPDHGRHVILDRCNATAAERRGWMDLALIGKRDKGVVSVYFDVPVDECKRRVVARTNHPTIPFGRGRRIVDSFAAKMQMPTVQEGFERVHIVRDEEDANALLAMWGAAPLQLPPPPAEPDHAAADDDRWEWESPDDEGEEEVGDGGDA